MLAAAGWDVARVDADGRGRMHLWLATARA
jgi:hypothetical protein